MKILNSFSVRFNSHLSFLINKRDTVSLGQLRNKSNKLTSDIDDDVEKFSVQSNDIANMNNWHRPTGTDTGIIVYNCIAKTKVPLILKSNCATWYSCGPTVYDSAHIGHASCYVKLDIIQSLLIKYFNINLITCMGITDVDDKIIKKAKETGRNIKDITQTYEEEFWKNLSDLGVSSPDIISRVTDHIPSIVEFIEYIMDKNLCYVAEDKSIYFDTAAYAKYGKLQDAQQQQINENILVNKKSIEDFALWKSQKEGEPFWETKWGNGRPGWHIECSAMASRLFGSIIDFHAGGADLQFPHHENEEAQSCAYHNNNQWINYWIHTGHLHLKDDIKMSKSLQNTISISKLLENYSAESFRMACLISHYRKPMEFSENMMNNSEAILSRFRNIILDGKTYINNISYKFNVRNEILLNQFFECKSLIDQALRNDFNTSKCITLLLNLIIETRKTIESNDLRNFDPETVTLIIKFISKILDNFGIYLDKRSDSNEEKRLCRVIDSTVKFRQNVRARALETKDSLLLKECDILRDSCALNKIRIKDSKTRSTWLFEE